ncbi:MAG: hypothetical protein ISN29_07080 [Gammaproteobacteria bacterium AqS3]|nr:hypothetical protein [Gammaproteobacteria bacterium AqS3]
MYNANGIAVRLDENRYKKLQIQGGAAPAFSEAVNEFEMKSNKPLVVLVFYPKRRLILIGRGDRRRRVVTAKHRVNIDNAVVLKKPLDETKIFNEIHPNPRTEIKYKLDNGDLLDTRFFQEIIEAIVRLRPELKDHIELLCTDPKIWLEKFTLKEKESLALQKETVSTSLQVSGIEHDEYSDWQPKDLISETSCYLDGLGQTRMREDSMIHADMSLVPGFDEVQNLRGSTSRVFHNRATKLTVTMANRLPLEEQTGADLIYYNETYHSFVMVQYKAMEKDKKGNEKFRFPEKQFEKEIMRMQELHNLISEPPLINKNSDKNNFRLNYNPFFFKFCPRDQLDPLDAKLVRGIYLPIEYWKYLENDPDHLGPRKGRSLTYENVGRYFSNTDFIILVSKAWVGTSREQSEQLKRWIQKIIKTGDSITFSVQQKNDEVLLKD